MPSSAHSFTWTLVRLKLEKRNNILNNVSFLQGFSKKEKLILLSSSGSYSGKADESLISTPSYPVNQTHNQVGKT